MKKCCIKGSSCHVPFSHEEVALWPENDCQTHLWEPVTALKDTRGL